MTEKIGEEEAGFCLLDIDSPTAVVGTPNREREPVHRKSKSLISSLSLSRLGLSFSYDRINSNGSLIQLTVVKLDGSSFGIEVEPSSRVADLKRAVERAFSFMPRYGPDKISWGQVWGHFCLSYDGHKLVEDNKLIRDYGMCERDKLEFTRHVSAAYNRIRKKSAKQTDAPRSPRMSDHSEAGVQRAEEEECDHLENLKCSQCLRRCEQDEMLRLSIEQPTVSYLHRRLPSYTRLEDADVDDTGSEDDVHSSCWLGGGLFSCFRKVFQLYNASRPA